MSTTTRWWWIRHAPVESGGRIYGFIGDPLQPRVLISEDIREQRPTRMEMESTFRLLRNGFILFLDRNANFIHAQI